ncbi:MAG: hypothetical protein AAFQ82_03285 [Myxococcota bacterium]
MNPFNRPCPGSDDNCPSELTLDRYVLGELEGEALREVTQRRGNCELCAQRILEREQGFSAFPELDSDAVFARAQEQAEPRAKVFRFPVVAPAIGIAAAAALLVFAVQDPAQDPPGNATRLKGGVSLGVFRALEGGGSERLSSGARFSPGDRVRFEVGLPNAGHVAIFGVEPGGARYQAWPQGGGARRLDAGVAQVLEGAAVLDGTLGEERLELVVCDDASELLACTGVGDRLSCPEGCSSAEFLLNKTLE